MGKPPLREQMPNGVVRIRSDTLTSYSRKIKPGVLVIRQQGGDTSEEMAQAMQRELLAVIEADGSVAVFIDLRGTSRFDASSRAVWIDFFKKHRKSFRPGCGLIGSKVIEMAASIIGLAIGSDLTRSTTQESEFIRQIQQHDPTFTLRDFAEMSDPRSAVGNG
jgi:anti-anti-sigma regulatory factor